MHHNKDNTEKREMNNSSTALHKNHFAGMHERCTSNPGEIPRHPGEQQREQNIRHGYYRSRIPEQAPVKEEAG